MKPGKRFPLTFALSIAVVLFVAACRGASPSFSSELTATASTHRGNAPVTEPTPSFTEGHDALVPSVLETQDLVSSPADALQSLRFEQISVEHGLSQSTVTCILQDSKGFMWFGTEDGLNRYDGYNFVVYRHDPADPNSPSSDKVLSIVEDPVGVLWIGTEGGGLDRFDRETERWRNYRHDPDDPEALFKNWIVAIQPGPEGRLWIGTYGGGLYQFDRETGQFAPVYDAMNPWINTVYQDRSGVVWVGTEDGGLYGIDEPSGRLSHYTHDPADSNSLSANRVLSIHEDRLGALWIGTLLGGLDRLDEKREHFRHYQNEPQNSHSLGYHIVASIYEDRSGALWIGTGGGGLDRFNHTTGQFAHYMDDPKDSGSLSSNTVLSIYQDPTGALWFGTMGGGVNRLDPVAEPFRRYRNDPVDPNSLSNNIVRAIWKDRQGALWVGTDGGLSRFDGESVQWRHYQPDPDDPHSLGGQGVRAIYEDQAGTLWVGVFGAGVNRFDPELDSFAHYLGEDHVVAINGDQEGTLWFGTQGQGLYEFDPETGIRHHYTQLTNQGSDFVRAIQPDRSGALWIGTDDGLHRLARETRQWRHYRHDPEDPRSLSRGWVGSLYQDGSGTLWVGTGGGGLNRFDAATEAFAHYTEEDGLVSDEVYGIVGGGVSPDGPGDHLWLSTNNGLSRFDPSTGTAMDFRMSHGLGGDKYLPGASHQSDSGEIFFGGVNGLVVLYPGHISENTHIPPIVLTSLARRGQDLDVGTALEALREVTFRWPDNSFEFEFAALDYSQPERNRYAYMLDGFDEDWIYIGTQRSGRYTNLPGGSYTLRLKGSNNDGLWNEDGVAIEVNIVPPIWQRPWFWGIVIVLLMAGVLVGYRLRVRNIEARSRALGRQVEERTAELSRTNWLLKQEMAERKRAEEALAQKAADTAVIAERNRLARELHDAVTQTLFSASLIAETLPRSWERDQQKGRRLLSELRQLSRGALAEMRTLLLELRPASLVEADLRDLLHQLAEAASGQGGMPVTVAVEGECVLPPDVHVALYRIAQEALNNAVKHARASQVAVGLRCAPYPTPQGDGEGSGTAELRVRDDGRGFDPGHVPPDRLGLGIMQERAQAIGAVLEVGSQPGQGTEVVVVWTAEG